METTCKVKLDLPARKEYLFFCGKFSLTLGSETKIMGILNVSDDSFSQDGIYNDPQRAAQAAWQMVEQGADIIDVGGESTRPGARSISAEEQKQRVLPVISKIAKKIKVPISIDTTNSEVASAALAEGASIVNDISGLRFDRRMAKVVAAHQAGCVLMHIQGTPQTMQEHPYYKSLIKDIIAGLEVSIDQALAAGIDRKMLVVDPGIGFGKTTEHNLEIIKRLRQLCSLDLPILLGPSRKSFIGNVLNLPVGGRLWGTASAVAAAIINGAHIVRVHDVLQIKQVIKMTDAILNSPTT